MRIVTHIKLFLTFILVLIAVNAYIGTKQINRISQNLRVVVNEHFSLVQYVNTIIQKQGQKALIMERAIRISEELNFENVNTIRRNYMLNHSKLLESGFMRLSDDIYSSLKLLNKGLQNHIQNESLEEPEQYVKAQNLLLEVERAHVVYNKMSENVLMGIVSEDYELTIKDVEIMENNELYLTRSLNALNEQIDVLSKSAVRKTEKEKDIAVSVFRLSVGVSLLCSLLIAFYIVGRISRPLENLGKAASQIGEGNFDIKLKAKGKDEVAEVAKAFNTMAEQLAEKNLKLRTQSEMLQENLRITEEQKKDLEKVNEELDKFVYTVSHDIGAPLMGIVWYGNYLKKNTFDKVEVKEQDAIQGIVGSAARLNTLIKDLLTLTRIARIKNPFDRVSINEIVQGILDRIEFLIRQTNTEIILPQTLPDIVCDRIKMGEVFYNLISNGIKFSAKTNQPKITIGYQDHGDVHQFYVQDNGIGIDPKYHDEVFGIFRRLHTYAEYEGSGAGLSIVKTIINDHGGNIWVESHEGEGARFVFTIPKDLKTIR